MTPLRKVRNFLPSLFLQFDTPCLQSRLVSVGVSLGRNEEEVSVSANALRHLEFDRLRVTPNA